MKEPIYGFPCCHNPNDFTPDVESCTAAEIAAHALACQQWKDGSYMRDSKQFCEAFPYDATIGGKQTVHISRTPWGVGTSMVDMDEEDDERGDDRDEWKHEAVEQQRLK